MQNHIKKAFDRIRKRNTLATNFYLTSGVATVDASARNKFWFSLWEVRLSIGWTMAEGVNGIAT